MNGKKTIVYMFRPPPPFNDYRAYTTRVYRPLQLLIVHEYQSEIPNLIISVASLEFSDRIELGGGVVYTLGMRRYYFILTERYLQTILLYCDT